jgi:ureidoacrylate peracid hydrolase
MEKQGMVLLQAEPGPLEIELKRTALLIIDMQNAFVSKGGIFDLSGNDMTYIQKVIVPNKRIIESARSNNIKVVYAVHRLTSDVREVGPLSRFRFNPGMNQVLRKGSILEGTWGTEIIDELKPRDDEMVIIKRRFSAFSGTELDMMLRSFDIRYLIFTGVATNICVESSLRDASHLQYLPVLVSDATAASPASRQQASLDNIKDVFGWVTTSSNVLDILH